MAKKSKKTTTVSEEFMFHQGLWNFYLQKRNEARKKYKYATKKFLDFNNPDKSNAFLRKSQYEAFEMYIFLKEYLDNRPLNKIFEDWYDKKGLFHDRTEWGDTNLFGEFNAEQYRKAFEILGGGNKYPNYIYALTMGTGKTFLMATCIFYEFLLASKYPDDNRFCKNAIVFAPDTTVLESLREIQTCMENSAGTSIEKVVPREFLSDLRTNIHFHFLDTSGTSLETMDRSEFNIIITNTQKIILKRQHKEKSAGDRLYAPDLIPADDVYKANLDLYEVEDDEDIIVNQRFQKLCRLERLGIYLDEAHHAFGKSLQKDLGQDVDERTSLRLTIDELASQLKATGTSVTACHNYTGTPYVGKNVLPEVVYAYGLKDAIEKEKCLKNVSVSDFENPQELPFVRTALTEFCKKHKGKRYEGMLAKIAFFAPTIDEVIHKLKPKVEKVLGELGISTEKILVNVGDEKYTSSDDIRRFNRLDTPESEDQFILLVNKGKEGWNCRSLFSVALFRKPKSKIFVLQATMRAMRAITDIQQTADIYLSKENTDILKSELEDNFRLDYSEFNKQDRKKIYEVVPLPPPIKLKIRKILPRKYQLNARKKPDKIAFGLDSLDISRYQMMRIKRSIQDIDRELSKEEIIQDNRSFSKISLVAETARYLNKSCLEIESIFSESNDGLDKILELVNKYNDILYDRIIPYVFNNLYEITYTEQKEEREVLLVREPEEGYYVRQSLPELVAEIDSAEYKTLKDKTFHLSHYCFDSNSEMNYFHQKIQDKSVEKIWFTGMFKHGETELAVQYIDPESHTLRTYYPDFVLKYKDVSPGNDPTPKGRYSIVEVKGDDMYYDRVVQAKKEAAANMAEASNMEYLMIKSSDIDKPKEKTTSHLIQMGLKFIPDDSGRRFKDILPFYTLKAACGKFALGHDIECEGWVEVPNTKLNEDMFIIQATGNSMSPKINDGDYCIFLRHYGSKDIHGGTRKGKIVLVQHHEIHDPDTGGQYTIKKYMSKEKKDGSKIITLIPENKDGYEEKSYENISDENEFILIGELLKIYTQ